MTLHRGKRAGGYCSEGCGGGGGVGEQLALLYLDVLCLIMPEPPACTHTTHLYPEAGSFAKFPE